MPTADLIKNRLTAVDLSPKHADFVVLKAIADFLPKRRFETVLDYGAGNSPWRKHLDHGQFVTADVQQNADNSINHIIIPGRGLPIADGTFDLILLMDVLEHTDDPSAILIELKRLLKKGGALVISVPFLYREHETPFDFIRFTSFGLSRLIEKAGLETVRLEKCGNPLLTIFSLFNERAILNGEQRKPSFWGRIIDKLANTLLLPLLNVTLFKRPPLNEDGVYHHLLAECRKSD